MKIDWLPPWKVRIPAYCVEANASMKYCNIKVCFFQMEGEVTMDNLVVIQNKQVVVSSRKVAESFNKMHKHVLASIKHLINSAEKSAQWFKQRSYKDSSGKSNIEYLMNRNGFMLLVMGFNGKTAIEMKIAYINAFDEMEAKLRKMQKPKQVTLIEQPKEKEFVRPQNSAEYMSKLAEVKAYITTAQTLVDNMTQERLKSEHKALLEIAQDVLWQAGYRCSNLAKIKLQTFPALE